MLFLLISIVMQRVKGETLSETQDLICFHGTMHFTNHKMHYHHGQIVECLLVAFMSLRIPAASFSNRPDFVMFVVTFDITSQKPIL